MMRCATWTACMRPSSPTTALANTTGYSISQIRRVVKQDRDAARDRRRMAAVAARAAGWSLREIAAELNVGKSTILRDLEVSHNTHT